MSRPVSIILLLILLVGLSGCVDSAPPEVAVPVAAAPVKPEISGVLAGTIGKNLDEGDRQIAFDAQMVALEMGQRQTWRGKKGTYGIVEPGAESVRAEGACRDYAQKVYVGGRPQSGNGTACRKPDGNWHFIS